MRKLITMLLLLGVTLPAAADNYVTKNIGAEVQWYEWDYARVRSGYRYDLNHSGNIIDIGVVEFKLGKSSQDRTNAELRKEVAELSAFINQQAELNGVVLQKLGSLTEK